MPLRTFVYKTEDEASERYRHYQIYGVSTYLASSLWLVYDVIDCLKTGDERWFLLFNEDVGVLSLPVHSSVFAEEQP